MAEIYTTGVVVFTRVQQAARITVPLWKKPLLAGGSKIFCSLSITKIAVLPDLALPIAQGNFKESIKGENQTEMSWRTEGGWEPQTFESY